MSCRPERWLYGLPCLAAIWGVAAWRLAPEIEARLRAELASPGASGLVEDLGRGGARIDVDGRDLSVVTDAELPADARAQADRLAASLPGLRRVNVRFEPSRTAAPFTFAVRTTSEGLTLSGFVPPGGARADLLQAARTAAPGRAVTDELRSALGAPEGLGGQAALLVRAAALLERARAGLADGTFELEGSAPDPASYNEAMGILRDPGSGFSPGRIQIVPPLVSPYLWSASRQGDTLRLDGNVPSESSRAALLQTIRDAGLTAEDRMQTARGLRADVEFAPLAEKAVAALRRLDSGTVSFREGVLAAEGSGAARDLLPQVERDLRQWRHPGIELGRIELRAIPASPYRFSATRNGGRVTLAGFAPGEAERSELLDFANQRFPFDAVSSQLHLADGAPVGLLPATRLALERLSALSEGEATLTDRHLKLAGRSPYPELAARIRREVVTGLPPDWTGSADIAVSGGEKPLDPRFCEDLLNDAARREPLRFEPGSADPASLPHKAVAGVVDVLRRCGPVKVAVVSRVNAADLDAGRALSLRRAASIVNSLKRVDVGAELIPVGQATPPPDPAKPASDEIAFEVRS